MNSLSQKYAKRPLKERALITMTLLVIVVMGWDSLWREPYDKSIRNLKSAVSHQKNQLQMVNTELSNAQSQLEPIEDDPRYQEVVTLEERLKGLDGLLQARKQKMIPPTIMANVLSEILQKDSGLSVVSLKNLPPQAIQLNKSEFKVYRHRVELTLNGTFADTLDYLQQLESLNWDMQWNEVSLQTTEYPQNKIDIKIQTISDSPNWIGV